MIWPVLWYTRNDFPRASLDPWECLALLSVGVVFGVCMGVGTYCASKGVFGADVQRSLRIGSTRAQRARALVVVGAAFPICLALTFLASEGIAASSATRHPGWGADRLVWAALPWFAVSVPSTLGAGLASMATVLFAGRRGRFGWIALWGHVTPLVLAPAIFSSELLFPPPLLFGAYLAVWQCGVAIYLADVIVRPDARLSDRIWWFRSPLSLPIEPEPDPDAARPLHSLRSAQAARLRAHVRDPVPPLINVLALRTGEPEVLEDVITDLAEQGEETSARVFCDVVRSGRANLQPLIDSPYCEDYVEALRRLVLDAEPARVVNAAEALVVLRRTDALPAVRAAAKRVFSDSAAAAHLRAAIQQLEELDRLPRSSSSQSERKETLPASTPDDVSRVHLPKTSDVPGGE